MSEERTYREISRNVAMIDLVEEEPGTLGIFIKIERVGENKAVYSLERSDRTVLGSLSECKIIELSKKFNRTSDIVKDILDCVQPNSYDSTSDISPEMRSKISRGIGEIQTKWRSQKFKTHDDHDNSIDDTLIDLAEYEKHKDFALQEAEKILSSEHPIEEIAKHLDNIIAGEEQNKRLVFVLGLTGLTKDKNKKTIVCALHEAGAGKTWLLKNIVSLFYSHTVSHFSKRALNYLGDQLAGRVDDEGNVITDSSQWKPKQILFLMELGMIDKENSSEGNASIKMLSVDDGGLTTTYTVRDKDTDQFKTVTVHTDPITVFTSSTRAMGTIDGQFVRRYWVFSPDASIEQTYKIEKFKVKHHRQENLVKLGLMEMTDMERSRYILKALVQLIEENMETDLMLPFYESIFGILEKNQLRIRSDYDKIDLLIEMYSRLNMRSLETIEVNGNRVAVVDPKHIIEILKIARDTLVYMAHGTEARVYELMSVLKELNYQPEAGMASGVIISPERKFEVGRALGGKSIATVHNYFRSLPDGFITEDKANGNIIFKLNLTPDEMMKQLTGYKSLDDFELLEKLYRDMVEEGNQFFEEIGVIYRYEYDHRFIAKMASIIPPPKYSTSQ